MIRVLFVHHKLVCGGAEQALFDLCLLLDKSKFEVTVLEQEEGGIWENKFRNAGINVIYDHSCQIKSINPLEKLRNLRKRQHIRRARKQDGEGLIDACFPNRFDIIVSYSVWKKQKTVFSKHAKAVKYIHGDVSTNADFRRSIIAQQDMLVKFDRIICVSEAARRSFCDFTGLNEGVEMHFNPLNSSNVLAMANQGNGVDDTEPTICAVGRLAPEKGFSRLIFVHKRLLDKGIKHKLVIVGDGNEKDHLLEIIRGTKTEDSVILVGYAENPYPYMKNSRFVVCSSYTEGLPVIAMEALALGVPIVSSVPSIGEAFGDEVCGIITENDDNSLELGIEKMLTDLKFYYTAKTGAQRRSEFFDGRRMVKEIEDMFIELANEC